MDMGFPSNFSRLAESSSSGSPVTGSMRHEQSSGLRPKQEEWGSLVASVTSGAVGNANAPSRSTSSMSRGDFENVEARLSPPRALAISEPPPTTEKYSFIPVNIGTKVEVTMACYEAVDKFYLSPVNLPDFVSIKVKLFKFLTSNKNIFVISSLC